MPHYDPASYFGAEAARRYDDQPRGDEVGAARLLADLAGGGPALEFVIGTGRIAPIPLDRRVAVQGIERSPCMIERLRAKPCGAAAAHPRAPDHFRGTRGRGAAPRDAMAKINQGIARAGR